MDQSSFRELWLKDETNGYIWPWNNPVQPLFEARFEKFFWGGDIGFQIYSDDHLDEVYAELGKTTDQAKRAKMLADAQIYLRNQWAAVPILNVPQQIFAAPKGKIGSWKPMRAGECTNWDYIAPPA
jgi:ABC-type transport system substrate-binding protein